MGREPKHTLASAQRGGPSTAAFRAHGTATLGFTKLQGLVESEGRVGLDESRSNEDESSGDELELHE